MKKLQQTLEFLCKNGLEHHLSRLNRGLEKESLRVNVDGNLAHTPHPYALGSALTHPFITTDYSEALLEFVTPVHTDTTALLDNLFAIHHFTYQHLAPEKLWVTSMPCIVQSADHIPIARYGSSNIAQMKEAYRHGLRLRYGSLMQTIAGIHFNFSMPQAFWGEFLDSNNAAIIQQQKSVYYFSLIRNFHRHSWLGCYLFGASPAVCKSFLRERKHDLEEFDAVSFHAPGATSLRLGDIGYNSKAQASIDINYNNLEDFVASLSLATQTPHAEYKKFGIKKNNVYQQLNACLLQIENEFYSVIRPKRVTESGQSPCHALQQHGVEYVEVRSIDLNPFIPIGIDAECLHFFDLLLLYCLFSDSPPITQDEWTSIAKNNQRVVMRGRYADLELSNYPTISSQQPTTLPQCATALLQDMQPLAELLDQVTGKSEYSASLQAQLAKVKDPQLTPSARIMQQMSAQNISFYEFAMGLAEQHENLFKQTQMAQHEQDKMRALALRSHQQQKQIEAQDQMSFDEFLADYFQRQNQI